MATRKQFEKELAKIGWSVRKSGNGLNDYVLTEKKKRVRLRVIGDERIELANSNDVFKESFKGCIVFYFKDCDIDFDKESNAVTLQAKGAESVFMSFYNFD